MISFRGSTSHFRFDLSYIVDFHSALTQSNPQILAERVKPIISITKHVLVKHPTAHPRQQLSAFALPLSPLVADVICGQPLIE